MRRFDVGILALGWALAACGGGEPESAASAPRATASAGDEQTVATSPPPAAQAPRQEIVEVDESRLPQQIPEVTVSTAETTGEPSGTSAEGAAGATAAATGAAATGAAATTTAESAGVSMCPTEVASLRVRSRSVNRGAAIVLTARGAADVDHLRNQVREFALSHSEAHAAHLQGAVSAADPSTSTGVPDETSPLLEIDELRLVEIPNGVRIEMRYRDYDRASVRELRARMRADARSLDDGICPISFQMT